MPVEPQVRAGMRIGNTETRNRRRNSRNAGRVPGAVPRLVAPTRWALRSVRLGVRPLHQSLCTRSKIWCTGVLGTGGPRPRPSSLNLVKATQSRSATSARTRRSVRKRVAVIGSTTTSWETSDRPAQLIRDHPGAPPRQVPSTRRSRWRGCCVSDYLAPGGSPGPAGAAPVTRL
jgi:hypothetical protein